jgi:hypothetical protein
MRPRFHRRGRIFFELFWNKCGAPGFITSSALTEPNSPNTMTYFPYNPFKRPARSFATSFGPVRHGIMRDILWNQPVFKAPALPIPRFIPDPLPFTPVRVTQRS